jgi:5-methylcytosine-specific restriction enzyme subunit McrC
VKRPDVITVYEHESLKADGTELKPEQLKALQSYYGENGVPYFSLIHNGVRFNEFVGVIQVGKTVIEVLPKSDKNQEEDDWRTMLIGMLRSVKMFDVHAPTSSSLKLKSNSVLDLYFELFLNQVEGLLHRGLTKKYRKIEGNIYALKGSIHFSKHLQNNVIHKERFYVRHNAYDVFHLLHQVLYKAITLIEQINANPLLNSRVSTIKLWFPEMEDIKVSAGTFDKIILNRKTEPYRYAIEIAKLLLLNFHPDVSKGKNNVLALMFDMNLLWERFIYACLRNELKKRRPQDNVSPQASKHFWKPENGYRSAIRPDIVITRENSDCIVIDTKWKNLTNLKPSDDDLKQMFVYHEFFVAKKVALAYPGNFSRVKGNYFTCHGDEGPNECSLIGIPIQKDIRQWQQEIAQLVIEWMDL